MWASGQLGFSVLPFQWVAPLCIMCQSCLVHAQQSKCLNNDQAQDSAGLLSWCNSLLNHLLIRFSNTPSPLLVWLKIGQNPLYCLPSRLDGDAVFSSSGLHRYSYKPKCHGVPVSCISS